MEAQNLRALTSTQSSLLGGENTPLRETGGTGFNGIAPHRDIMSTPNPLATPLRTTTSRAGAGSTPLHTPRDVLALNQYSEIDEERVLRQKLRMGFASLPKPKNDFELVIPDEDMEEDIEEEEISVEDAEERDRKVRLAKEAEEQEAHNRKSQVLRRNLPRPRDLKLESLLAETQRTKDMAQKLVLEEMTQLLLHDASRYPLPNTKPPKSPPANFVEYSTADMAAARAEIAKLVSQTTITSDIWANLDDVTLENVSSSSVTENLTENAPLSNKLEKKLTLILGGYQARQTILSSKIKEVSDVIEQARIDLENYHILQDSERATVALRLNVCPPSPFVLEEFTEFLAACRGSRDAGAEGRREAKTIQGNDRN